MDQYSRERWVLDRHDEMAQQAEVRSRLLTPAAGLQMGERVAMLLRRMADRLDIPGPPRNHCEASDLVRLGDSDAETPNFRASSS
ncbi:MAG TPA: hypothetical protein VGG90_10960 [Candidatus Dormibacteraeota bacterium]